MRKIAGTVRNIQGDHHKRWAVKTHQVALVSALDECPTEPDPRFAITSHVSLAVRFPVDSPAIAVSKDLKGVQYFPFLS